MPERGRGWSDWALAAEALVWLAAARAGLALGSFAQVAAWAARRQEAERPADPRAARAIGRAVTAAARRAPFAASCFTQALAAQAMLRRRRLPARLFYGARNAGVLGPAAHVWVRSGGEAVVGAEIADRFALVASFPPGAPSAAGERLFEGADARQGR
jgi:hypothetical protein